MDMKTLYDSTWDRTLNMKITREHKTTKQIKPLSKI